TRLPRHTPGWPATPASGVQHRDCHPRPGCAANDAVLTVISPYPNRSRLGSPKLSRDPGSPSKLAVLTRSDRICTYCNQNRRIRAERSANKNRFSDVQNFARNGNSFRLLGVGQPCILLRVYL